MCLQGDKQPGSNLPLQYLLQILEKEKKNMQSEWFGGQWQDGKRVPIALGESTIGEHAVLQHSAASSFSRVLNFLCFLSRK